MILTIISIRRIRTTREDGWKQALLQEFPSERTTACGPVPGSIDGFSFAEMCYETKRIALFAWPVLLPTLPNPDRCRNNCSRLKNWRVSDGWQVVSPTTSTIS